MTRAEKWYASLTVLGLVVALGVIDAMRTPPAVTNDAARDATVDSLLGVIAARDGQIVVHGLENRRLQRAADSSARQLRAALARPSVAITARPDSSPQADTVARMMVMRAVDSVPFLVPSFMMQAIVDAEAQTAYAVKAWQASEEARLYADSVYIPDLKRQVDDGGKALRLTREQVDERDGAIRHLGHALKVEKTKTKAAAAVAIVVTVLAVVR